MGRFIQEEKKEKSCADISASPLELMPTCLGLGGGTKTESTASASASGSGSATGSRSGSGSGSGSNTPPKEASYWEIDISATNARGEWCGSKMSATPRYLSSKKKTKVPCDGRRRDDDALGKRFSQTFTNGFKRKERDRRTLNRCFLSSLVNEDYKDPVEQTIAPLHERSIQDCLRTIYGPYKRGDIGAIRGATLAPLFNRKMCTYSSEFIPRSLSGVELNKVGFEIQKNRNETTKLAVAGKMNPPPSNYQRNYYRFPPESARKAVLPPFIPTQLILDVQPLKHKTGNSISRTMFPEQTVEQMRIAKPMKIMPRHSITKIKLVQSPSKSTYDRNFDAESIAQEFVHMMDNWSPRKKPSEQNEIVD